MVRNLVLIWKGNLRKNSQSFAGRLHIPSDIMRDSQFPLKEGQVEISIVGDHLEVRQCK